MEILKQKQQIRESLETGSVSIFKWGEEDTYHVGSLRKS
jgi:hypothetical protein